MKKRIGLDKLLGGVMCACVLSGCITHEAKKAEKPTTGPDGLPVSWVNPPRDDVRRAEFEESDLAPLVSMGSDGKLVYKPYSDHGDRILDFSTAGYKRNEEPIPTVPVVKTLTPPEGELTTLANMQYPMGPDSFELIQSALDEVAAMEPDEDGFKGAVLLKKGTWYISEGILVRSGVVLRGEGDGEDGTVLMVNMPKGNGTAIQVGVGGGTTVQSRMPLSGILSKQVVDGEETYVLTLSDGTEISLRTPGFSYDYAFEDFVDATVTLTLPLLTTSQGNLRTYRLKHNMPYTLENAVPGEPVHDPVPGLELGAKEAMPESRITDPYVPSGATQITVEDAGIFAVGDLVNVVKTTNEKWIEVLGVGERLRHIRGGKQGLRKKPWRPQNYGHLRTVTAIDGNTIMLDVMMPQSIVAEHGGGTVRKAVAKEDVNCGVENLRIVSNYDKTQTSNSKSANYANLRAGVGISAKDGWVRDITVLHSWYAAVRATGARFVTLRDCTSLQPIGAVRGGKRYTFQISGGNNVLFYNCYAEDGRHDFVIGARMAGPYVFYNSKAVRGGQSEPHARWGVGTLYDNITMQDGGSLAAINRGDSGSGHGWAAANTVFWNCDAKNIVVYDNETEGENNFAFGYTGSMSHEFKPGGLKYANTRAGYWGTPREGVFYGYPLMGSGHIENPNKPMPVQSLFLQQLIDRLGEETAMAVLK